MILKATLSPMSRVTSIVESVEARHDSRRGIHPGPYPPEGGCVPMNASIPTTGHCSQCDRQDRISEPFAFRGMDRLRATLACGHVVLREEAGL